MGRVAQQGLKSVDAAAMLQLSHRKVKRMWRRCQQAGRQGMKHAHAGRPSNLKSRKPDEITPSSAEPNQENSRKNIPVRRKSDSARP
jgi:transposase